VSARLPVAMLGAGHVHAPGYLRNLSAHRDVKVVGVYDADPARARLLAERSGVTCLGSVEDCLKEARAVVVCCEPTRQLPLVRAAIEAGLPTLCEKPLGTTLAEANELLDLSKRAPISVAFPVRYHSSAVQLRQAVQESVLGPVSAVWATNRNSFPGGWFADPALAGGGCLLDHVVHVADLLRWIWGTEYVSVTAEAGVLHTPGLTMEDTALVLVECTGGMIATIDPSMSRPRGMPGALDLTMQIWAENGTATLDVFSERLDAVDREGVLRYRPGSGEDMDAEMIDDWVSSVAAERPAPVPASDGFAATCLAFAAQRAVAAHQTLTFPI
jgi:predicted dehydrogenase